MCKFKTLAWLTMAALCPSILVGQDIEQVTQEKAWSWSGAVGANTNMYAVSGIPRRSNPFFYNVHAQFTGKIYGFELPFSFSYGQHNFAFNRPFLQVGISPSYKWIKLHLGTRNLFFSPYTLAGHTFTGAGVELTPGKWRLAAMTGTFRRARILDEELDPRFYNYLYKRSGHAFKVGYGTATSYIDISYLYGKDDPTSITFLPPENGVTPSRNHALGISTAIRLTSFLNIFADGGVSLFTRNINSIESPEKPTEQIAKLFNLTISSRINYAYKIGADFKIDKFRLRAAYERIMPEFETMGAFFFVNDRENITVAPSFTLFKNKLSASGNLGIQRNNLLNNRSETTSRLIGSANLAYFSPKGWGVNFNYTNFSTEQVQAAIALSDSVRLAIVTTNLSITPTYSWVSENRVNALVASYNYQQVNDRNPFTREFTNMNTSFINVNHNLQYIESGWGFSQGINYNYIELAMFSTTRLGISAGFTKSFSENKFNSSLQATYNLSYIEGNRDGINAVVNANLSYVISPKQSLSGFVNIIRNQSAEFNNYTEILGGLSYSYRFR